MEINNTKDLLPIIQALSNRIDEMINDVRTNLPDGFTLVTTGNTLRESSPLTVKGINLAFYFLINLDKVPEGFAQEFQEQLEDREPHQGEPRGHKIQNQYMGRKSLEMIAHYNHEYLVEKRYNMKKGLEELKQMIFPNG